MKIINNTLITVMSLVGIFFGIIGVIALVTKQEYVTVMNMAFDWIKGLSA